MSGGKLPNPGAMRSVGGLVLLFCGVVRFLLVLSYFFFKLVKTSSLHLDTHTDAVSINNGNEVHVVLAKELFHFFFLFFFFTFFLLFFLLSSPSPKMVFPHSTNTSHQLLRVFVRGTTGCRGYKETVRLWQQALMTVGEHKRIKLLHDHIQPADYAKWVDHRTAVCTNSLLLSHMAIFHSGKLKRRAEAFL